MERQKKKAPRGSTGKLIGALLSSLVIMAGEIAGYLCASFFPAGEDLLPTFGGAVAAVIMIVILGGGRYIKPSFKAMCEAFRFAWWVFAMSLVLMVFEVWSYVQEGTAISSAWLANSVLSLVLCLCIGVVEEGQFRVLILGGFLGKAGSTRRGLITAVFMAAALFGLAHIDFSVVTLEDPLTIAQAALKVCQTGMYGVMLSAIMLKSQNATGVMLFHALDDFVLFVISTGLYGEGFETSYVSSDGGEEAWGSITLYIIVCVLYLPTFIKAIKTLRHDIPLPDYGPLLPEAAASQDASAAGSQAAPGSFVTPGGGFEAGASYVPPQPYAQQPAAAGPYSQPYPQQPIAQDLYQQQPAGPAMRPQPYPQQPAAAGPYPQVYPQRPVGPAMPQQTPPQPAGLHSDEPWPGSSPEMGQTHAPQPAGPAMSPQPYPQQPVAPAPSHQPYRQGPIAPVPSQQAPQTPAAPFGGAGYPSQPDQPAGEQGGWTSPTQGGFPTGAPAPSGASAFPPDPTTLPTSSSGPVPPAGFGS